MVPSRVGGEVWFGAQAVVFGSLSGWLLETRRRGQWPLEDLSGAVRKALREKSVCIGERMQMPCLALGL